MFGYDKEKKKVKEVIQQLYRDFTIKYGEIQKSELPEAEKQEKLNDLIENTKNTEAILIKTRNLTEIAEEDKEILGIKEKNEPAGVDTKVVDTLVEIFSKRAKMPSEGINVPGVLSGITLSGDETLEEIDTTGFEEELRQYFTEHYADLLDTGYNDFLSHITEVADEDGILHKKNGELVEIAIKYNIDPEKFSCFGHQLTIQNGLVAEEEHFGETNVFYASPEAINQRIYDLYSKTFFQEKTMKERIFSNECRELKNAYVTYAEKNGIEIQDKEVLEELPIDMNKVQGIASYINRVLQEKGKITEDMTEKFVAEIQKEYAKIMNLSYFNFSKLDSVEEILENGYASGLNLQINEDNIIRNDDFSPDIAYGTPQYVKDEYRIVMGKIKQLSYLDAFSKGAHDIEKANKEKEALRRYITENEIEGIDISVPEVEVDHKKTEMIAEALLNKYGETYENQEEMKARILKKVEEKYPEMVLERQVMGVNDLIEQELQDMGENYISDRLYLQDEFIYVGDIVGGSGQCIYATPEAILEKIEVLDEKIATKSFCFDEKRQREQLEQYAKENHFEIEIPNIEIVENRRQREEDRISFRGDTFGSFYRDVLPDDPTARPKIELEDTTFEVIYKISEGLPGAMVGITDLMKSDEAGFMLLLGLDDMNIRGSQIWEAYKYLYHEDGKKFAQAVKNRDKKMVDFINEELATVGGEKAVTGGASFDRNKQPNKYRFTQLEVEELQTQKEERHKKEREAREKMIANSPAKKKSLGQKKRETREAKRKAYRERLIAMGKRSLGELDEELTGLQEKEEQAKQLCQQYEEQVVDRNGQEL